MTGSNSVILSGTNSYTGGTTVIGNGTLTVTRAVALPGYNSAGKVVFGNATQAGTINVRVGGAGWTTGEVDTLLTNATKTSGALGIDTSNGNLTQWTPFTTTNLGSTLGLTKLGANTLILDQTNTYAGRFTASAGTTTATTAAALSGYDSAGRVVFGGGTIGARVEGAGWTYSQVDALLGNATKTSGALAIDTTNGNSTQGIAFGTNLGPLGLTKSGSNTLTLNQANTYTGATTLGGGTLLLSGGNDRLPTTTALTFTAASTLDITDTTQTLSGLTLSSNGASNVINGAGGSLIVNYSANPTWTTTVSGTTVNMAGLGNLTLNRVGGDFQINGNGANVVNTINFSKNGTNTFNASNIRLGGGAANAAGQNTIIGLGQTNNVNASGEFLIGFFQGSGNASFQSGLTNPTLTVRGAGGTGPTPIMAVGVTNSGNQPSTGILNLTGGSLDALATDFYVGRHFANAGGTSATGTLTMPAGSIIATTFYLGAKTGNSTGAPTINGTFNQTGGNVTATTVNLGFNSNVEAPNLVANYNLNGGSLLATTIQGSGATYGGSTLRNLTINGGTLQNLAGGDLSVNGLATTATGRINVIAGASGANFNADATRTITLGANTVLSGGNVTKSGAGTLALNGNNTYTGLTTVSNGALTVGSGSSLVSGNALTLSSSGTANFANAGQTLGAVINDNTAANALNFSAGSGTVTLASLTGAGNTTFGSNGAVTGGISSGAVSSVGTLTANISGTANVSAGGLLTGNISAGTVGAGSLSSSSVTGGTNNITGNASVTTLNGGATTVGGISTITTMSSGAATLNGATSAITTLNGGTISLGNGTVLSVSDGTSAGAISGAGGALTKISAGTLTLSANNTFTGPTNVNQGTLLVNGPYSSATNVASGATLGGSGTMGAAVTLDSGTIGSSGSTLVLFSSLATTGNSVLAGGSTVNNLAGYTTITSGTFTVNGNLLNGIAVGGSGNTLNGSGTIGGTTTVNGGTIGGTLALGTLIATGNSTIASTISASSGTTVSSGGVLSVTGTLSGGAITVASGATLKGSGTVVGATTINGGLAPGNSPGVLTFADNLTLTGTSVTTMEVNGAVRGTDYDGIDLTGTIANTLTYGGNLTMSFGTLAVGVYDLFSIGTVVQSGDFGTVTIGGSAVASSTGLTITNGTGWTVNVTDAGSNVFVATFVNSTGDLTIAAIPEPSAFAAMAGLGAIGLVLYRRRRQSVKAA